MLSDGRHQPAVDAVLKLIVIGDTGAGKSSIMHRFIERRHDPRLANTTGVEFGVRTVLVDGSKVKLHVWDTAGQERFRSVTKSYYRGAVGCIIVFDLTNRGSFEHVGEWLREARRLSSHHVAVMLVGNKSDLEDRRQVPRAEAVQYAQGHDASYTEASACTGDGIDACFEEVARQVLARIRSGTLTPAAESGLLLGGRRTEGIGGGETAGWGCCAGLRASGAHIWWPHEVEEEAGAT
mmetsp:Transcript_22376/g.70229  ORF Transcript_22376/g.70229 Transcript_22376/m.70229 type:complete len:237 (+) Transcript_22376:31-741(+)